MSEPEVTPDPALGSGHALIRIPGAAAAVTDPRFRLTRDGYDAGTLGPRGWQVADTLLEPLSARVDGADLVLSIGPALVNVVESGVIMLGLPAAKFDEPVFWPELPLLRVGAGTVVLPMPAAPPPSVISPPLQGTPRAEPTAPPPDDLPVQPSPSQGTPGAGPAAPPPDDPTAQLSPPHEMSGAEPAAPPPGGLRTHPPADPAPPVQPLVVPGGRSVVPFVLIGLLVLAAAGGGAWYMLHRPTPVATPLPAPTPTPPQQTPSLPTPASPSTPPASPPTSTTARDCSQGSIAGMVACAPDPAALTALALQKWDSNQADQGLVLLQIAADRGSGVAALKLAQIYDPNTPSQGERRVQPNAREAAQYYRRAAQAHEDAAAAPREALRQRLQHDAENGDAIAPLTLKDFWP